MRAVSPYAPHK